MIENELRQLFGKVIALWRANRERVTEIMATGQSSLHYANAEWQAKQVRLMNEDEAQIRDQLEIILARMRMPTEVESKSQASAEGPTREELLEALKAAASKGPEARGMFDRFGIVFDRWPMTDGKRDEPWTIERLATMDAHVRWQGVAFALYTLLCEIESRASAVIDAAQGGEHA